VSAKMKAAIVGVFLMSVVASLLPASARKDVIVPLTINGKRYEICIRTKLNNPCPIVSQVLETR
jgi:hypothetical protein